MSYKSAIVIFTDTWRRDHLGFYGNDRIKTPAADRLASESIIFEDAFPESLATIQVRRAYFTGKRIYPWRNYEQWWKSKDFRSWCHGWQPLSPDDVSITEILRKRGYVAGLIADIPFYGWPAANFHRAFNSYEFIRGKARDQFRIPSTVAPYYQMPIHTANYKGISFDEEYFAPQVFRSAMKWLDENYRREKFYLHLEVWDPHEFWYPPECYVKMYDPEFSYEKEEEILKLIFPTIKNPTQQQVEKVRALYAGMVTQTDFWMGVFLDYARNLGVLDDAIVIFVSDHGTNLGERGIVGKPPSAMYDELVRIPLTIRLPDGKHSKKRVEGFAYDHDLTVTLLGLLDIESPEYMEGLDIMPLVTEEKKNLRDHIICGYNDFVCVRDEQWHYITADRRRITYPPSEDRLYDVRNDPEMKVNAIENHPSVAKKMKERIKALWKQYGMEYEQP